MTPPDAALAEKENRDELTPEEARVFLGEQTQRYLGISLERFYELADQGRLPDNPMVPHLVLLSGARPGSC